MRLDNRDQVELPVALQHVLVDGHALEEAQPVDMIADHELVALGVAPDHERPLDRRTRRCTGDHPTAIEQPPQFRLSPGVEVGIGKPPVPSAGEEHAARRFNGCDKSCGIRDGAIARVKDLDVARTRGLQVLKVLPVIHGAGHRPPPSVPAGSMHPVLRRRPTNCFRIASLFHSSADDHQSPARGAKLRRCRGRCLRSGTRRRLSSASVGLRATATCSATEPACLCASLLLEKLEAGDHGERLENAVHSYEPGLQVRGLVAKPDPDETIHPELISGNDEQALLVTEAARSGASS